MRIVYVNYFIAKTINTPEHWWQKMQPVNNVLEQLAQNHNIISVQQINYTGTISKRGVNYHFINLYRKKVILPLRLNFLVKKLNADVVIIHGTVFPIQTVLLKLFVSKDVKIIIQHHSEQYYTGVKKILQKIASLIVDGYFFPSISIGKKWQQEGNISLSKPIFIVHEGASIFQKVDKEIARLFTKISGDKIYIWVGRLDAKKRPLQAIKAFISFLKVQPMARLYMLFYSNTLLDEVTTYLLESQFLNTHIFLIGKVNHKDMFNWYSSADFYISSSLHEGTSFTLSEAMSCGCIPIVTNIHTHTDMLGNKCGVLYESSNENALLEALVLSTNLSLENESLKASQQYKLHLSATAIANNIELALTQLP